MNVVRGNTVGTTFNPNALKVKSAYDYAKEGGYTGTEEEFAVALANMASVKVYDGSVTVGDKITFSLYVPYKDVTFTITAEDGMTWEDFINSDYNTDYFGHKIVTDGEHALLNDCEIYEDDFGEKPAKSNDKIIANHGYHTNYGIGGE